MINIDHAFKNYFLVFTASDKKQLVLNFIRNFKLLKYVNKRQMEKVYTLIVYVETDTQVVSEILMYRKKFNQMRWGPLSVLFSLTF